MINEIMRPKIKPYLWKIILIFIRNFDIFFEFLNPHSHLFWVRMRMRMLDLVRMFTDADADVRCITSHGPWTSAHFKHANLQLLSIYI